MASRHRTPSEDLEPAILAAAEALLEELGPDALSIRRIAERARVAPMGLYTRFDGKHGVVDALFKEGFTLLGATIRATAAIGDPTAAFRAAGQSYRALALAHPARYRLMFLQVVRGFEPERRRDRDRPRCVRGARRRRCGAAWTPQASPPARPRRARPAGLGDVSRLGGARAGGINFVSDPDAGYERAARPDRCGARPRRTTRRARASDRVARATAASRCRSGRGAPGATSPAPGRAASTTSGSSVSVRHVGSAARSKHRHEPSPKWT